MMRSTLLAAIALTLTTVAYLATETVYRSLGFHPDQYPGWTISEYLDQLESIDPTKDTIFLGDSRVGWGVADRAISRAMAAQAVPGKAINLGLPGAGVELQLRDLLIKFQRASGVILINYSVGAFYTFGSEARTYPDNLQKRIDQRILDWTTRHLVSAHRTPIDSLYRTQVAEFWDDRIDYPQGFVNARLRAVDGKPIDPRDYQLEYYKKETARLMQDAEKASQRLAAIATLVQQLRARGWRVALLRLPIGVRMKMIEDAIPERLSPSDAAPPLALKFFDLTDRVSDFPTQDESHLTPEAAVAIAPVLAAMAGQAHFN